MITPHPTLTKNTPTLLWFRQDLRLEDNAALLAAVERGKPIIPVFIWSPEEEKPWPPGAAARWWLHQSLAKLQVALAKRGSNLVLRSAPTGTALERLIHETHAGAVYWNRRYEPSVVKRDSNLKDALRRLGIAVESFNGNLLFEPWTVKNQSGQPFRVFTAFSNSCMRQRLSFSPSSPPQLLAPTHWPHSERLDSLRLEPSIDWASGLRDTWEPGEIGAHRRLADFLRRGLRSYKSERDRPDHSGTSMLSPHLHFGEISPAKIWHAVQEETGAQKKSIGEPFLRQLLWREFAYHLLFHFPETQTKPLRAEYSGFPFRNSSRDYQAWCQGQTGYPLVDAGMRQLWHCGWMHNRVRMVVASFLVKHLLVEWQEGAAWFWDTLVDADLANNTLGWQWVAGCGADAAPYFRIFNPVSQAMKFDPTGDYIRHWVPELAQLSGASIHQLLDESTSSRQRVMQNGKVYPSPLVSHKAARQRALEAWAVIRR